MFWEKHFDYFAHRMQAANVPARVRLWNGAEFELGQQPRVTIAVPKASSVRHLVRPSLDRLGQAYVEGKLEVEGRVMDIIDVATRLSASATLDDRPPRKSLRQRRHSRKSDADAIAYHYDVSNDFYALWLDRHLNYSCGYFRNGDDTLDAAQEQKMDHILRKLCIREGDTLLDIGCGWGGLAMRAAEKYGARAMGITLSQNQYELACERIRERGLQDRCEVRIEDYRDTAGRFDRVVSVGMFEHVGLKNLPAYFSRIQDLLHEDGAALIHGITSTDADSRESPWGGGDFIGRYVFPDGELPHIGLLLQQMSTAGLEAVDVENLRRHYAMTMQHWADRFEANAENIRHLCDEKYYRIWRVYLAGCAYGFLHNWIAVHQLLVTHASSDRALPLTRDYIYPEPSAE